ncbi:DNA-directed RNA polymerase subunit beta [Limosilactobacillus fermentum]|nr:DNA-directed RNA polymerase subunit beta [Limosilactobacillus fermentum]
MKYNIKNKTACQTSLKTVDQNNRHLPDITTLIHDYNANDIVIDADRFIPLQEIRNVDFKNTEKL